MKHVLAPLRLCLSLLLSPLFPLSLSLPPPSLQATGLSLGLTVRAVVNLFANYIIIFSASWPMGLASLATLVIFILEGFLQMTLTNLFVLRSLEHQGRSLKTAIEAIDNVYTIISLGIEKRILEKYKDQLKPAYQ